MHIPPCLHWVELFGGSAPLSRFLGPSIPGAMFELDPTAFSDFTPALHSNVSCFNLDFLNAQSYLALLDTAAKDIFIYADPPYLHSSRKSSRNIYNFESSDQLHESLLSMAAASSSNFAISHYQCDLYDEILHSWNRYDFQTYDRYGARIESLYFNYEVPHELACYDLLGSNYTTRQGFGRKKARWLANMKRMPVVERNALIHAFAQEIGFSSFQIETSLKNGSQPARSEASH